MKRRLFRRTVYRPGKRCGNPGSDCPFQKFPTCRHDLLSKSVRMRPGRTLSGLVGRAGIEPATNGLKAEPDDRARRDTGEPKVCSPSRRGWVTLADAPSPV